MKIRFAIGAALICLAPPGVLFAGPPAAAFSAFDSYAGAVASRLEAQHRSANGFLGALDSDRLRQGEPVIEKLTPATGSELSGGLLHHWRGTAFAPGAQAADFERVLRDFNSYPQVFAPEVTQAMLLAQEGDHMLASMRVRQKHVITVEMDTTYDIRFGRLDSQHRYSISQSKRIAEVGEEHDFLWRLNTFWSYEERDGGLYLQIEAVSLTRAIPRFLEWAIRGYVESIPRESLEFTLRSGRDALKRTKQ